MSENVNLLFEELQCTASTNTYLLDNAGKYGDAEALVYTKHQTAGRGTGDNTWESEPDKNLAFSLLSHPVYLKPTQQNTISMLLPVVIVRFLKSLTGLDVFSVKWPNDVYADNRKIAGMLIENRIASGKLKQCVAGIGLNVNQTEFHSDAPNPVSLKMLTAKDYNLDQMMTELGKLLFESLHQLKTECQRGNDAEAIAAIRREYHSVLYRNDGCLHDFEDADGIFSAKIKLVDENGRLCLERADGSQSSYWMKEVRFRLNK